jgi:hypothetical protein
MSQQEKEVTTRKRKGADACSAYLDGKSRKVHKLRHDVEVGLKEGVQSSSTVEPAGDSSEQSTSSGSCFTCKPVLELFKPTFQSLVRADIELRHSKTVLPNPVKPDKIHYRNLVAQNQWIRSNLFDALGNYKFCQTCINSVLEVGTQRLAHQRTIKRRLALFPLATLTKSDVMNKH